MQNSNKESDNSILKRYLEGNFSEEDRSIIKQWFMNNDPCHELYENSLQFWEEIPLERNSKGYNGSFILDMIHHKIKIEEAIFLTKLKPGIVFINYLTRIAAILFIPLLIASLLFYFQINSLRNGTSYSEIYSPVGSRTSFYLPDGSTGLLNGGSSLKFPTQFSRKTREVKLTGEAYFKVTSNHKKPFIVSTEKIDVKVFGTSFNVMAYADEQVTEVTLESGQIELFKNSNNNIKSLGILKPNESCVYNSLSDSSKIQTITSTDKLSWIDGKLTFKYEPFGEVVRKINRWYNVNIVIKDESLQSYIYYGTFEDETLEEVLRLLHFTAPIRYNELERKRKADGTFEKRRIEIYYKR